LIIFFITIQIFKKSSTKVPTKAKNLSFKLSGLKIREIFLDTYKVFLEKEKNIIVKLATIRIKRKKIKVMK